MDWSRVSWHGVTVRGRRAWMYPQSGDFGKKSKKSMDIPRKRHGMWKMMRGTQGEDTLAGWLRKERQTSRDARHPRGSKARPGHSAFLGITFEGGATNIRTERTRTIDCYRQGHRGTNRGSYFAPAVLKKTSSGSANARAKAKLHALVKSSLSEKARGLRGKADGGIIQREQE